MLDTNLINVENIKATVAKIKEWVLNLYPFTYIAGGTPEFKVHNDMSKVRSVFRTTDNGVVNAYHDSTITTISSKVTNLLSTIVKIVGLGSELMVTGVATSITGKDSAKIGYSGSPASKSYAEVKSDGTTTLNTDKAIISTLSNGDSLTFNNGDIILKDADGNNGCIYLGVEEVDVARDEPYCIYNGTPRPMGYVNKGTTTETMKSGTTFSGWGASSNYLRQQNLFAGTWLINASIKSDEALVNGKRVGIAVYLETSAGSDTYEMIPASRQVISTGANTYSGAQCCVALHIPYVSKDEMTKVQIRGFQSSGSGKKFTCDVACAKIS